MLLTRYISPALASPRVYGLVAEQPGDSAKRALVQLSYVVRHLGAGTAFNLARDPSKQALNVFLQNHSHLVGEFLARITAPVAAFPAESTYEYRPDAATVTRALIDLRAACVGVVLDVLCTSIGEPKKREVRRRRKTKTSEDRRREVKTDEEKGRKTGGGWTGWKGIERW